MAGVSLGTASRVLNNRRGVDPELVRKVSEAARTLNYVRSAVAFKPDEDSIRSPDHWDSFFAARKRWAAEEGYDPAVIEAVYRTLYDFTIEIQLSLHAQKQSVPRA